MTILADRTEIEKLSVRERLDLIDRVLDTIPETVGADEIPDWHIELLERRLATFDESSPPGKPWREVLDRIEAEL